MSQAGEYSRGVGELLQCSVCFCGVLSSVCIVLMKDIAASGGTYGFAKAAAANLREKDDSWNPTIGGFLSGGVIGLRC